jgi:hypothetical protein
VQNVPLCSDCRCELPGFETLCSKCFGARYSALGHPKSFLESVRQYVSNPFGITPEQVPSINFRGVLFCCCAGLLVCWFGGFARVGYRYPVFSHEVFSEAFLVVVKSAVLSLGLSLYLARKNLGMYWEIALGLFLAISICYARWCWHVGVFPQWLNH